MNTWIRAFRCHWDRHEWFPPRDLAGRYGWQQCLRCRLWYDRAAS